jgi:7-carboxy-7-deazaguanine synthase
MRLSEIYTSVQGEGPDFGELTQFVRFAGCNLRCAGWACDTQHAIDPAKYRHEWETVTPNEVAARLRCPSAVKHITLTGGEPFLQPANELDALVSNYLMRDRINVFTNGTILWSDWVQKQNVCVIMDWKLPGSGENDRHKERLRNLGYLTNKDAVKFVCVDKNDFWAAHRVVENHPELFQHVGHLYLGVAWGKLQEAEIVEWLKVHGNPLGFKLNVQVHNYIFNREDRGI